MINFDAVDLNEHLSEEVMFLLMLNVPRMRAVEEGTEIFRCELNEGTEIRSVKSVMESAIILVAYA